MELELNVEFILDSRYTILEFELTYILLLDLRFNIDDYL